LDKSEITNKFQWPKFQTEEKRFDHLKLEFGISTLPGSGYAG
jgi:hypothetical protein